MGSTAVPPCHLVAVPYPGRGHVNAMLNLCHLLAAQDGVTITVVVTEEWLGLLGTPAALPELGPRVRFEAIPNVIPSEHGHANDMVGFIVGHRAVPARPGGTAGRAGPTRYRAAPGRRASRAVPVACSCLASGPRHGPWAVWPCCAARWHGPFSPGRASP
jgi:hypothetical protein